MPTYDLRVEHPTDSTENWEVEIKSADDARARERLDELARKVYPPRMVHLYPAGGSTEIASAAGYRKAKEDDEQHVSDPGAAHRS
jgi:hypothetical protein